ncbi:MAG: C40 family peptidase [Acidiferrobacterales bacterium]
MARAHTMDRYLRFTAGLVVINMMLAGCSTAPVQEHSRASIENRVAAVAHSMVGRPYHYGGDTPKGFDCSGLVYYSYARAGERVPRTSAGQRRAASWIPLKKARRGDLLFFNERGRWSSHVGIYIGNGKFVHAPSSGERVRTDRLNDPYWRRHFVSVRRFPFL